MSPVVSAELGCPFQSENKMLLLSPLTTEKDVIMLGVSFFILEGTYCIIYAILTHQASGFEWGPEAKRVSVAGPVSRASCSVIWAL